MATRAAKLALRGKALSDTGTEIGIVNNADATAITIDASENVGIGVVPEAWNSTFDAIQIGDQASIFGQNSGTQSGFAHNMYFDGAYKHITTSQASRYVQSGGSHVWSVAPSGTADTAISFTTAMTIDNSGSVGIGTATPTAPLHIVGGTSSISSIQLDGGAASNDNSSIQSKYSLYLNADSGASIAGRSIILGVSGAERLRIDSSGNVLVGKTASSLATVGLQLNSSGASYTTRSAATAVYINRTTSHGEMVSLRKDNVDVGTIGAAAGDRFYLGGGTTGFKFANNINAILPYNPDPSTLADRDAAIDLGYSTVRYKDLYLSGGVYLGGTGAANKLDDYEEGTFSPTIQNGITSPVYGQQNGSYIKIGSSVWFSIDLQATSGTANSSAIQFGGLPFASSSSSAKGFGEASWSYGNMINSHSLTAGEFGMHITWGGTTSVTLYYGVSHILGTSSGVNMNGRAIISGSYRTDA